MAEFAAQPVDYSTILGNAQSLVPNPMADDAQRAQLQAQQLQNQAVKQKMAALKQKATRAQEFQTAFAQSDGSPGSVSKLMGQFLEFTDTLKTIHDATDADTKQSNLTALSEIYFPAQAGNYTLAARQARTRFEADKAAGNVTPGEEDIVKSLESGDPAQQKAAASLIGAHIYAADPTHFHDVFGMPGEGRKGQVVGRAIGHYGDDGQWVVDYRDPDAPQYREIQTTDANGNSVTQIVAVGGGSAQGGGGPASGGGATGGVQASVAHVLGNEGGLNPSDMNGAPTNFGINYAANKPELAKLGITSPDQMANLTKDQAAQIYAAKYWPQSGAEKLPANLQAPYFDVYVRSPALAKKALAQSGGDPAKFAEITNAAFQNMAARNPKAAPYAHAWATRDAGNAAIATGQAPGAPAAQPPGNTGNVVYSAPSQRKPGNEQPPGNADLSGPAYIADLQKRNPSLANQVQGVLDTRLAYPPATARSPQAQQLRAAVLQADPSYDEQAYKRRQTTIQQYTPGHTGPGASMLSAATLINHMYELAQAARELPDHSTRAQNAFSGWIAGQTNAPWLIKFNEGRKFVASELPKFLNGKAPTEGEQRDHYDSYSPSKGKGGIQTALSTDVDYLYGRYQPLIQAYKDSTGKDLNVDDYAPGQATRAKAAALEYYRANGALPVVVTSAAQAAKLPHGAVFATPDGRVLTRH